MDFDFVWVIRGDRCGRRLVCDDTDFEHVDGKMNMREPASIRYKNPGAMWGSALAIKWGAAKQAVSLNDGTGQGNNIAVFPTYVQGICAQMDLWRSSKNYRNKRFSEAIRIWSGGNHVESYIKFVTDRVPGMTRDTVMDEAFWRGPMAIPFLKAQAWHEAGKPYPAPEADWIEAHRIVLGAKKPAAKEVAKDIPIVVAPAAAAGWAWPDLLPYIIGVAVVAAVAFIAYRIWKSRS
jgi:hypothetical protein